MIVLHDTELTVVIDGELIPRSQYYSEVYEIGQLENDINWCE